MAPTVYCVRHAQGYHNLKIENHTMPDPDLTPFGEQQCRDLQASFPHHDDIDLIVASPIRRTIYTALLSFEETIKKKNLTVITLPELQETSDLPCDTGSDPEKLAAEFKDKPVDFSLVHAGWNCKRGKWKPDAPAISKRASEARQWLKARPEKHIVVVTHGGFLHYFTNDWDQFDKFAGTGWQNTEWRAYGFKSSSPLDDSFVELEESLKKKKDKPLDSEERTNLKKTTTNESGSNGAPLAPQSTSTHQKAEPITSATPTTIEQQTKDQPQQIQAKV